jgi:hypothetical protein
MREMGLSRRQQLELEDIYAGLEKAYSQVADELQFSCRGCPDNCCDSYFLHHSYVEWIYLWHGLSELPSRQQQELRQRADCYLSECGRAAERGERPQVMCPLNESGLCLVYQHRLLVCRTHGVPARMRRPDGQVLHFPGCFRCQEIVAARNGGVPEVDRTALLSRLARLERDLRQQHRLEVPRLRLTIAEMLLQGPPRSLL